MPGVCRLYASGLFAGLLGCAVLAACGQSEPVPALFTVPRDAVTQEFYELPFPNDLRRDAAGKVDMTGYPRPVALVNTYIDACETLDGFGTNSAIFTRFAGPIDTGRLPVDAQESVQSYASVYLVDVDPASPGYGQRSPLVFRFQDYAGWTIGANWLGALPAPGFPLRQATTYALVVTRRLDATPSPDFEAILAPDGPGAPTEPALVRAREVYAPLLAWLDEPGGDERGDVASAAVFTTQSVTPIMGLLRERVRSLPPPLAYDVRPRNAGENPFTWYDGMFDAPNFQTGALPYNILGDGDIVLGTDGLPVVQRMEPLRVSFTIPAGRAMPASGWPVAIYAHGTGGSFHSFVNDGTARALAEEGIAGISIDQVLHPPRSMGNPETDFFNFQNPYAARNNPIQGAADDFSVVRLVESIAMREDGRVIRFDPSRIYFFGHSQGGLTGPPFVAYEPLVQGAVLSGAGGTLYNALLNKTEPVDITALVSGVIIDSPLDQWNPVLAILQMWVERSDSVNYGPLLVREPPPGVAPRPIFQTMGFVDHYTPLPTIEAFAVSIGGHHVGPAIEPIEGLALLGRAELTAPVSGNLGGTTAVIIQYEATDSDGHFVVFDVAQARRQSTQFLSTLASTGTATVPP
ncbi:MAG: hypothetical protein K8M05_39570 [Deltaproteobacteria bacterium]|nr:hypothetical protein [Kofleriaceae bacterium]